MQYIYNHHLIKADDHLASNCSIHKIISDRPTEERQEGREEDRNEESKAKKESINCKLERICQLWRSLCNAI